jgi:hypothetical protein
LVGSQKRHLSINKPAQINGKYGNNNGFPTIQNQWVHHSLPDNAEEPDAENTINNMSSKRLLVANPALLPPEGAT